MPSVKRTQKEIDELINRAYEVLDGERQGFFGMSFEQGVVDTIDWLLGSVDDCPIPEDE